MVGLGFLGHAYRIYEADILSGALIFRERTRKHPLMLMWFFLLFLTALWLVSTIIVATMEQPEALIVPLDPRFAYFGIFFMFFTLGGLGTHFRMMRNSDLTLVVASPIRHGSIVLGKLLGTFWINMGIYAFSISCEMLILSQMPDAHFFSLWPYVELTMLAVLGTIAGFLISMLGSLQPLPRKAGYMLMGSLFLTGVWYGLGMQFFPFLALLGIMIGLALVQIALASGFFLEGWNSQTTVKSSYSTAGGRFFMQASRALPLSGPSRMVAAKEFLYNARTRENLGSALTILGIITAEVAAIQTIGGRDALKMQNAYLIYPVVNAMAIYIGAILFCTVEGMTLLGKEAKSFWIVKVMPVRGKDIMKGKAAAAFMPALFLIAVALPVPLLLYGEWQVALFSVIGTLCVMLSFLGVGVWMGATAPNFTASFRGTPDVITLYSTMMACLVLGAVLLMPALYLFRADYMLGLAASCVSLAVGAAILFLGLHMAGRAYDRLEVDL